MDPRQICEIGEDLCRCEDACQGIMRSQRAGIYPRGLRLEAGLDPSMSGTVVCGQNPGTARPREVDFMKASNGTYESVMKYWDEIQSIRYFERPRRLIRGLGRQGPILWTDLVKCQNKSKDERLAFNRHPATFRHCGNKFLRREIALVPEDWLVVCLGKEAYRGITFMFPTRPTLGLPHSSGSYGRFTPFFKADGVLKDRFKKFIVKFFEDNPKGTYWLDPKEH